MLQFHSLTTSHNRIPQMIAFLWMVLGDTAQGKKTLASVQRIHSLEVSADGP